MSRILEFLNSTECSYLLTLFFILIGLNISARGIIDRDEYIFKQAVMDYNVPIVMTLSGKYIKYEIHLEIWK